MLTILGWIAVLILLLTGICCVIAVWWMIEAQRYVHMNEYQDEQARRRLDAVKREWDRNTTIEDRAGDWL